MIQVQMMTAPPGLAVRTVDSDGTITSSTLFWGDTLTLIDTHSDWKRDIAVKDIVMSVRAYAQMQAQMKGGKDALADDSTVPMDGESGE